MSCYFSVCSTAMYQQRYLEFLLEHYDQLRLPYSFPVALSFLASPLLMEKEAFLCFNEEHEVVGAFAYIHGTGENQYEDTHIIQMQIAFLRAEYRGTRLFLEGLQFLTQYLAQLEKPVKEIRFWAPASDELRRLFDKISERTASVDSSFGPLEEYRASFEEWHRYGMRFRHERYFG